MADVFDTEKRSEVMSRIRGRGNKTTELAMMKLFREHGLTGWRRHQKLPGKPDFVFRSGKVAVFVDGCFWHGCPRCYREPRTRKRFWRDKINGNKKRDGKVARTLRSRGWKVARVWECSLRKQPQSTVRRIARMLGR